MCTEFDIQLGRRLRRRRRLLGLSQQALAERCGVRFQQIQKYEAADSRVSAVMLGRLAHALGVSVDYFYDGLEALMETPTSGLRKQPGQPQPLSAPAHDGEAPV